MLTWTTVAPAVSAAFLSSVVEVVEAFTIVLAVATVRGWRPASLGAMAGLVVLALIVVTFGPLLGLVPLRAAARGRPSAPPVRHALAAQGDPARRRRHCAA